MYVLVDILNSQRQSIKNIGIQIMPNLRKRSVRKLSAIQEDDHSNDFKEYLISDQTTENQKANQAQPDSTPTPEKYPQQKNHKTKKSAAKQSKVSRSKKKAPAPSQHPQKSSQLSFNTTVSGLNGDEDSDESNLFANRVKKRDKDLEDFNAILSKYTQDEPSNSINQDQVGHKEYESDLFELQMLEKKDKKIRKTVKEPPLKVKNKYFSDLQLNDKNFSEDTTYGEQPPENEELFIEKKHKKENRKNFATILDKKVEQIKNKREFKGSQNDAKYQNQIKNKLTDISDAEQVEVDVEIPHLFSKQTTSAALYIKSTVEKEEKIVQRPIGQNRNQMTRTSSLESVSQLAQAGKQLNPNKKQQDPKKKKGVNRNEFYSHLVKQIKTKNTTQISSQEIKQVFKSSTLEEGDLQIEIQSNASSHRSLSHKHSVGSNVRTKRSSQEMKVQDEQNSNSRKFLKDQKEVKNENQEQQLDDSLQCKTQNRRIDSKASFWKASISQEKESDISSSQVLTEGLKNKYSQRNQTQKSTSVVHPPENSKNQFPRKSLCQQQLKEQYPKSSKMFESSSDDDQSMVHGKQENLRQKGKIEEESISIAKSLHRIAKEREKKKSQKKDKKRKSGKVKNKSQKTKTSNSCGDALKGVFQEEAGYSSDEQGHSDEPSDSEDQIDPELAEFIDSSEYLINSKNQKEAVRKFLNDERVQDERMIERIKNKIFAKKKAKETDSDRKLRQRMQEAARRNKELEKQESSKVDPEKSRTNSKPINEAQTLKRQQETQEYEQKKFRQFEEEFGSSAFQKDQHSKQGVLAVSKNPFDKWSSLAQTPNIFGGKNTKDPKEQSERKRELLKQAQAKETRPVKKKVIIGGRKPNRKSIERLSDHEPAKNKNKMQKTKSINFSSDAEGQI